MFHLNSFAMTLKVDLQIGNGQPGEVFAAEHIRLLERAAEILELVVNSTLFHKEVLNYQWKRRWQGWQTRFSHSDDSREEVLEKLMAGSDQFTNRNSEDANEPGDSDIDVWVHPYRVSGNVIGYTLRSHYKTFLNLHYLDNLIRNMGTGDAAAIELAENQLHEYMHNVGYEHRGNRRNRFNNAHSVPYALGDLVGKVAEKLLGNQGIPIAAHTDGDELEEEEWHWDESDIA